MAASSTGIAAPTGSNATNTILNDPRTLASDGVRTLLIDAQGRIWAGTLDQGLDILDPQTGAIRHFRHRDGDPHSLPSDAVCVLYTDHTGRIWVGTDGGLSEYQAATDDFVSYGDRATGTVFTDVHVRAIREDHTGAIWVGTLGGGVNRFDPHTGQVTVFRHDARNPRSLSHDHVWSVLEDDAQRLWVATADGLNLYDSASGSFIHYGNDTSDPRSLRDSYVMALYQDRGGVLWVGTRAGGASHWNPNSWQLGHYRSPVVPRHGRERFRGRWRREGVGRHDRRGTRRDRCPVRPRETLRNCC